MLKNLVPNMVMVVGWTTLAFVAIEYTGAGKHLTRWRLRDLPPPHARVRKSRAELNAIPNFGQKSIEEVIETLHSRGLDLQAD